MLLQFPLWKSRRIVYQPARTAKIDQGRYRYQSGKNKELEFKFYKDTKWQVGPTSVRSKFRRIMACC